MSAVKETCVRCKRVAYYVRCVTALISLGECARQGEELLRVRVNGREQSIEKRKPHGLRMSRAVDGSGQAGGLSVFSL